MMEEIFNWVMFGWLWNIGMFGVAVLLLVVKVISEDDPTIFINAEIYIKRCKPLSRKQKWASWLIPYYGAFKSLISVIYFIKNYNRDTTIVLIELDSILENYRIWKRGGLAN